MLGGFGFLRIFSSDRWVVTEQIVRFRAQSFTSASHLRERIHPSELLNGIEAGQAGRSWVSAARSPDARCSASGMTTSPHPMAKLRETQGKHDACTANPYRRPETHN